MTAVRLAAMSEWLEAQGPRQVAESAELVNSALAAWLAAGPPRDVARQSASRLEGFVAELARKEARQRRFHLVVASVRHRQAECRRQRLAQSRKKKDAELAGLRALLEAHGAGDRIRQAERLDRCHRTHATKAPPARPLLLSQCLDTPNGPPLSPMTGDHDKPAALLLEATAT